ncbi:MAG: hypothetical protein RRC34_03195 [Lentisphaeria bacterium]|nr:hypothetical protein [Lentisphaeria bacterium]
MNMKDSLKYLAPFVVIIVCVAGSFNVQQEMNRIRVEKKLIDTDIAENAPPMVVFTTEALGSFRGIVANVLWLYSGKMKDEGNYFEMYQLASWMVKLQPRFTGATAYLAWNMAYNISVTFPGFEDRWRWVRRGIELIRDEALIYNPGDPELYKELGWIYQHKMGQELDDANRYYKLKMAEEMTMVLGDYPIDWERFAAAPTSREGLDARLGEQVDLATLLESCGTDFKRLEKEFVAANGVFPETVTATIPAEQLAEIELCLRSRWLTSRLKLDPGFILTLQRRYGDLDWRLPEAHAIYWATLGLNESDSVVNTSCERMITQSLANAFRGGRLAYAGSLETFEVTPNIAVVDAVNQEYLTAIANQDNRSSFMAGYRNWLIDATVTLFAFGAEEKAAEYYKKLQERSTAAEHRVPLVNFVVREMAGDVSTATFDQAHALVQGFLFQGLRALAIGDDGRARAFDVLARNIWLKYTQQIGSGRMRDRRKLPPINDMRATMYQRCLATFPPDLKAALQHAMAVAAEEKSEETAPAE